MKKLSIAVLLGTSMLVTSCGLNMKPEHQQAYDSFEKRRAPRDNQIASTGGLADNPSSPSRFSEFSGSVVGASSETGRIVPESKTTGGSSQQSITDSVKATINTTTHQESYPTAPNSSIIDRLKEKFSFNNSIENNQFASARVRPAENNAHIQVASVGATTYNQIGQGSDASGYSYYDLADDIDMDAESYKIENNRLIQLAKNDAKFNPSAPLVDVEDAPSYEEIKSEANLDAKPQIKDIPAAPQRVKEHQMKNQIASQAGANTGKQEKIEVRKIEAEANTKQPQASASQASEQSEYSLEDKSAKVVYMEGKQVVTGTLGSLRK